MSKTDVTKEPEQPAFTKRQLIESQQFDAQQKDVLNVLLQDDQTYTIAQARAAMGKFLKEEAR